MLYRPILVQKGEEKAQYAWTVAQNKRIATGDTGHPTSSTEAGTPPRKDGIWRLRGRGPPNGPAIHVKPLRGLSKAGPALSTGSALEYSAEPGHPEGINSLQSLAS